jgi:hypothetical protein
VLVDPNTIRRSRQLAAALTLFVAFDVAWVRAPFLALLAVPFALTAWRLRSARLSTRVALIAWCALYSLVGVVFALTNGLHAPTEPNKATETISPGDFVNVYFGTPVAVALAVVLIAGSIRARSATASPAAA